MVPPEAMMHWLRAVLLGLLAAGGLVVLGASLRRPASEIPAGRSVVEFWHFWGGADRAVVDDVVRRFNASQDRYWVRSIAVPGNNFDAKLFMSVAGGAPPDLVNQDDPVLADWWQRGAIQPLDELLSPAELEELTSFLVPAARRLGEVAGRLIAVPNGLDVRMLYFNQTELARRGLQPPATIAEFDRLCDEVTPPGTDLAGVNTVAFLPDPRRLWSWGYAFGGRFFDPARGQVTLTDPNVVRALEWMMARCRGFQRDALAAYRRGDQTLPGKVFPLLPVGPQDTAGRYLLVLDGQWRVRDIEAWQRRRAAEGLAPVEFGVCPLPYPQPGGRPQSGWVNGNFFLVPRGARNPAGAWAFMQFWIGLGNPEEAAATCAAGGWIPVAAAVRESPPFQAHLRGHPLLAPFVDLAGSDQLFPYPAVAGAMWFVRETQAAAEFAVNRPDGSAEDILQAAEKRIQAYLDRQRRSSDPGPGPRKGGVE